jgi:hypothetical protein
VAPGPATVTASPWAYNGHIFALSEEGDTYVIEAADRYKLVRVNTLDDFSMATPAIVASVTPAARASRVDVIKALRSE